MNELQEHYLSLTDGLPVVRRKEIIDDISAEAEKREIPFSEMMRMKMRAKRSQVMREKLYELSHT